MNDIKLSGVELETVLRCVDKVFETRAAVEERDRSIAALEARIAALEGDAKQAREDEAWAHAENVGCVPRGEDGWQAYRWSARMQRMDRENAPTTHAALRALRAKVEGGAR